MENLTLQPPATPWTLNSEKLGVGTKLLNDASVLARRQPRVVLRLRTHNDHLSRRKNEGSRLGIADPQDDDAIVFKLSR